MRTTTTSITTSEIMQAYGVTFAQVEAAGALGLCEPQMRLINDSAFTLRQRRTEHYRDASHVREFFATAKALLPKRMPRSFYLVAGCSQVPITTVLRELDWTHDQLDRASAIRFPAAHTRRICGDDGIERVVRHYRAHDLDWWCDRVREFLGHGAGASSAPPAA